MTYPVLMTLLLTEVEGAIGLQPQVYAYLPKRTAFRAVMVAITVAVAAFVPYFSIMMDLIGAACVIMTVFVLPTAFYIKLKVRSVLHAIVPVLICALGLVGGCAGAMQATTELIQKVQA